MTKFRLYWDKDKGCYCVEKWINKDSTIKDEPQIIELPIYEPISLYQREGTFVTIQTSLIKPSKFKIEYKNIDDIE